MKKNILLYILVTIILVSLVVSVLTLSERHRIEEDSRVVEVMLSIQDIESLANANSADIKKVLEDFRSSGMTTVITREKSLGDLERTGDLKLIKGYEITKYYEFSDPQMVSNSIFIDLNNEKYRNQVEESILTKKIGRIISLGDRNIYEIPVKVDSSYASENGYMKFLDEIGVGFDHSQIAILNQGKFWVVPQIRSWNNYNSEAIDFLKKEIESIDQISFVLNNDSVVVGFPGSIDEILEVIDSEFTIPIGMVEFFSQSGLGSMIAKNDMSAVRVHSISDKEMLNFSVAGAIERYRLAVEERNIRAVYLKMFHMEEPMNAYESNKDYVEKMADTLEEEGFAYGKASVIQKESLNPIIQLIIALGSLSGLALIFIKRETPIFGLILSGISGILIAFVYLINAALAIKMVALLLVLVYPVLAFSLFLKYDEIREKTSLWEALKKTIMMSVVTFSGGIMMSALLSYTPFMIKTDQFSGVKIAHIIPLLAVPFIVFFWNKGAVADIKKILNKSLDYKMVLIGSAGILIIGYYLLRTGNQGSGLVLGIEERFREALNQYLGVRPRTKEFLIGYPVMFLIMYLGLNKKTWILIFPSIIGQISLANTYAHIHTPIMISLQRSGLGIIIGLVIGIILVFFWEILSKIYFRYLEKYF